MDKVARENLVTTSQSLQVFTFRRREQLDQLRSLLLYLPSPSLISVCRTGRAARRGNLHLMQDCPADIMHAAQVKVFNGFHKDNAEKILPQASLQASSIKAGQPKQLAGRGNTAPFFLRRKDKQHTRNKQACKAAIYIYTQIYMYAQTYVYTCMHTGDFFV